MTIEHLDLPFVREWWETAQDVCTEAARIASEDLTTEELNHAATYPDDIGEGIAALAPVLARHVHPDVLPALAAIVNGATTGEPPPRTVEECPGPMTAEELSTRVRRLERTIAAAGRWLSEGAGAAVVAVAVIGSVAL